MGYQTSFRFNSIGKAKFHDPSAMWSWLKSKKGTKLRASAAPHQTIEFWFAVEKSDLEQAVSSRITAALEKLLEVLKAQDMIPAEADRTTKHLPCDYLRGIVWFCPDLATGFKYRILDRHRDVTSLRVGPDYDRTGLTITSEELWAHVNNR